jgi:hypothetical protein
LSKKETADNKLAPVKAAKGIRIKCQKSKVQLLLHTRFWTQSLSSLKKSLK